MQILFFSNVYSVQTLMLMAVQTLWRLIGPTDRRMQSETQKQQQLEGALNDEQSSCRVFWLTIFQLTSGAT